LPIPRSDPLQMGPYSASTPFGGGVVSLVAPPAALIAGGTSPPAAGAGADEPAAAGAELEAPAAGAGVDAAAADVLALLAAGVFFEEEQADRRTRSPTVATTVMRRVSSMRIRPFCCGDSPCRAGASKCCEGPK
jgi:hypothetical protein